MTQEDKELLLKDLCARLPYETQVHIEVLDDNHSMIYGGSSDDELDTVWIGVLQSGNPYHIIKPYLRPMSNMTEEERNNLRAYCRTQEGIIYDIGVSGAINSPAIIDWLNKKMFDYRGLIEKGLALEAPEDMYKTE